jgi:mannitol/fructose-specific phosphotransferase system IIA component (Ntr-type)
MAYGRLRTPLPWDAPDDQPIRHVFLIVAPPVEVSNQFLPALGRLARVAREGASVAALERATTPTEVLAALGALGG